MSGRCPRLRGCATVVGDSALDVSALLLSARKSIRDRLPTERRCRGDPAVARPRMYPWTVGAAGSLLTGGPSPLVGWPFHPSYSRTAARTCCFELPEAVARIRGAQIRTIYDPPSGHNSREKSSSAVFADPRSACTGKTKLCDLHSLQVFRCKKFYGIACSG